MHEAAWPCQAQLTRCPHACRHAAREAGLQVVDWARMVQGMLPHAYLGDDFHPGAAAGETFTNVYLNMLLQHQQDRGGGAAGG